MLSGELPRLAWRLQGPGLRLASIDLPGDRDLLRDLDKVEVELPRLFSTMALLETTEAETSEAAAGLLTMSVRLRSRLAFRRTVPICSRSLVSGIQKWCLE